MIKLSTIVDANLYAQSWNHLITRSAEQHAWIRDHIVRGLYDANRYPRLGYERVVLRDISVGYDDYLDESGLHECDYNLHDYCSGLEMLPVERLEDPRVWIDTREYSDGDHLTYDLRMLLRAIPGGTARIVAYGPGRRWSGSGYVIEILDAEYSIYDAVTSYLAIAPHDEFSILFDGLDLIIDTYHHDGYQRVYLRQERDSLDAYELDDADYEDLEALTESMLPKGRYIDEIR